MYLFVHEYGRTNTLSQLLELLSTVASVQGMILLRFRDRYRDILPEDTKCVKWFDQSGQKGKISFFLLVNI